MPGHDDNEDGRLFREAIGADCGQVRRLPASGQPPAPPRPAPAARMALRDARQAREDFRRWAVSGIPGATGRGWLRDGIPPLALDRLTRGEFAIQAEFRPDPRSREPLQRQISGFLRDSRRQALGCVQIVLPASASASDVAGSEAHSVERALEHRSEVIAFHATTAPRGNLVLTVLLAGQGR